VEEGQVTFAGETVLADFNRKEIGE
jgi:hypothetical protein